MANASAKYLSGDTIAALSTPAGGAISVLRMSGPRAVSILDVLVKKDASKKQDHWVPGKVNVAKIFSSDGKPLDEALILVFMSPRSYTGENLVELHLHGSAWIARRCLESLYELGARAAHPGEFSFRAVKNGRMNLGQAEAVADLIQSTNDSAIQLALEKLEGVQNKVLQPLAESIRQTATLAEAGIDFSDQDIEEVSISALRKRLEASVEVLTRLESTFERGSQIQEGIRTAILGLPNAGKSSFFNALIGEERSIVSEIPGTTRDLIAEKVTLRAGDRTGTFHLVDTAGLRETLDPIEREGVQRAHKTGQRSDLLVLVLDGSKPNHDQEAVNLLADRDPNKAILGVLSKADLVSPSDQRERVARLTKRTSFSWIFVSSKTGAGIHEAAQQMVLLTEKCTERKPGELILTRVEHLNAVQQTLEHLKRALQAPELDLFAADIRQALYSMEPLIGETVPEDVLERVFSQFCIGK